MKSKPIKLNERLFRYDYDTAQVEYIYKADAEMIAADKRWVKTYGHTLYGIDQDGFCVVGVVGLSRDNWENEEARGEYLQDWSDELDEEAAILSEQFKKWG